MTNCQNCKKATTMFGKGAMCAKHWVSKVSLKKR